jgi:hypothetical protein
MASVNEAKFCSKTSNVTQAGSKGTKEEGRKKKRVPYGSIS